MKICLVLMGPIAGWDRNYAEGEELVLEDATAEMFGEWKYVEILGDADEAAEPTPIEPAAESPLLGGDLVEELELKTSRKSKAKAAVE